MKYPFKIYFPFIHTR